MGGNDDKREEREGVCVCNKNRLLSQSEVRGGETGGVARATEGG